MSKTVNIVSSGRKNGNSWASKLPGGTNVNVMSGTTYQRALSQSKRTISGNDRSGKYSSTTPGNQKK